jgi:hypothetical protein
MVENLNSTICISIQSSLSTVRHIKILGHDQCLLEQLNQVFFFFFLNIFYRVSLDTVIAINKLRVK